jgi:hypothetical protein
MTWSGLLALAWLAAVAAVPARAELTDGLVAYYSFDDGSGTVLSEGTGLSAPGELLEFPTDDSQWVAGQIGGALDFDGIDDFVVVPNYPLAQTDLTVSIWANADAAPTWGTLVKNWGGSIVGQFHFGLGPGEADTLNMFITQGDGAAFNAGTDIDDIALETWEHYAFVANAAEMSTKLYRNGEVVDELVYDGEFTPTPVNQALGIGVKTNDVGDYADPGAPGYWDGRLDDLGIWHRALSDEEISTIFANGIAGLPIVGGNVVGDFNGNGVLDAPDIDDLTGQVAGGANPAAYDLNADALVTAADIDVWVRDLYQSWMGDADLDGQFSSTDLVTVLASGTYEADLDSVWSTGDFNGDRRTNSTDLVVALADGGYEAGPRQATAAVPEPTSGALLWLALTFIAARRARVVSHPGSP